MAKLNEIVIGTLSEVKDETLTEDKLYDITDYPVGGITNSQMSAALTVTYNRFYKAGEVFICVDNGTYQKGRAYKFTGTSWELLNEIDTYPVQYSGNAISSGAIYDLLQNLGISDGTITLYSYDWSGTSYSLYISELDYNDAIIFYPNSTSDQALASEAGIFIDPNHGGSYVNITATTAPSSDITFSYIIIRNI